jgi:protein O-GlcNAc transferase
MKQRHILLRSKQKKARSLLKQSRLPEARDVWQQICSAAGAGTGDWIALGDVDLHLGLYDEALEAYRQALARDPRNLGALVGQSRAHLALTQLEPALRSADQALAIQPLDSAALLLRCAVLRKLKRFDAAEELVDLLGQQPAANLDLHHRITAERILIRQESGRYAQALELIDRALAFGPANLFLLSIRTAAFQELQRFDEALAAANRILTLDPRHFPSLFNKATSLAAAERFTQADDVFRLIRTLHPATYRELTLQHIPRPAPPDAAALEVDAYTTYVGFHVRKLRECHWDRYQETLGRVVALTRQRLAQGHPSPLPPIDALKLGLPPELQLEIARSRAIEVKEQTLGLPRSAPVTVSPPTRSARLRIGYVCGDFRDHPTGHLMRSMFARHDHSSFETYAYAIRQSDGSPYDRTIRSTVDHHVDLSGRSNAQAAERIRHDRIHVLVDLHGYTQNARLEIFAQRPAPVQVSYLAFPGTLGGDFIDYILVDPLVLPTENLPFFTEQPLYLPECYQVNDRWQEIADTAPTRASEGLPEQGVVFCCFNEPLKIEPVIFEIWMRVLRRVEGSVLWLLASNGQARSNLRAEAASRGVAPERLVFARRLPKSEHLKRHQLADLFLDTRIYNAHTTASDALWAGVPVLTCPGDAFPARVGTSLLRAVGLDEMIAADFDAYEELAVVLAVDPEQRLRIRDKLRNNRLTEPLFDTGRFVRHLEGGFRTMWENHAAGRRPRPLHVPQEPRR